VIGEVIGNFRVVRQLGKGGMGEVWLAEQKEIKTQVAIKILLPHVSEDKQQVQRFFNEAVAVSKIKHAGIAKIFDVGFHSRGEAYLIMEFLEGEPLSSRIERSGRLPLPHVSDVGRQIASVLEATHTAGITHRDLKPDNVFLVADAELSSGERVKILDFGIAKLSHGSNAMTRTGAGAMGTPTYMSPEQWKSTATVDNRADIYSLGCLLFEMACGRPPFVAESIGEICAMHLGQQPPSACSVVPELPEAFDTLVARLLAKSPNERPSLREVRTTLAALGDDKFSVVAPTLGVDAQGSRQMSAAVAAPPATPAKPTTIGGSAFALPAEPARKKSKMPLVAGAAVAAAVVLAIVFVATRPHGEAEHVPAAAPPPPPPSAVVKAPEAPAPATSHIRIHTDPPEAEVRIDGALVANPFDGSFAKSDVGHRIDVHASGHKDESRWLAFDGDHDFDFTLAPDVQAPVAAKPAHGKLATKSTSPVTKPTTTATTAATPPPPAAGSAAAAAPSDTTAGYKGTKGKLITTYPPTP
jgi:eukaryotic-like serine/threonine-protein kinase